MTPPPGAFSLTSSTPPPTDSSDPACCQAVSLAGEVANPGLPPESAALSAGFGWANLQFEFGAGNDTTASGTNRRQMGAEMSVIII